MELIPKYDESKGDFEDQAPCWVPTVDRDGNKLKPIIVCNCGKITGIGLHHVHTDGTVTASYYHKKGNEYPEDPNGCEWHVWLKLLDYNEGDFPSVPLEKLNKL